jgi:hypothetical protein
VDHLIIYWSPTLTMSSLLHLHSRNNTQPERMRIRRNCPQLQPSSTQQLPQIAFRTLRRRKLHHYAQIRLRDVATLFATVSIIDLISLQWKSLF